MKGCERTAYPHPTPCPLSMILIFRFSNVLFFFWGVCCIAANSDSYIAVAVGMYRLDNAGNLMAASVDSRYLCYQQLRFSG